MRLTRAPSQTVRATGKKECLWMPRHDEKDLLDLRQREIRIDLHQAFTMGERHVERTLSGVCRHVPPSSRRSGAMIKSRYSRAVNRRSKIRPTN
ncbi:MAG: hypothetical protein ABIO85_04000 [Sphingomicrobium sp.]